MLMYVECTKDTLSYVGTLETSYCVIGKNVLEYGGRIHVLSALAHFLLHSTISWSPSQQCVTQYLISTSQRT